MKVSGFTIARDVIRQGYPFVQAIQSILPICDEMIIAVGESADQTLALAESIASKKIRIIRTQWDTVTQKPDVLSYQTNQALAQCAGDWAFYVQSDEVIHEKDLPRLKRLMQRYHQDPSVDGFQFRWMHFYGSYCRYRIDRGWFQKQVRIIRNHSGIQSCKDAWTFERQDGQSFRSVKTGCLLYHYGWVRSGMEMTDKIATSEDIYAPPTLTEEQKQKPYNYGDLERFPVYYGSHPAVMSELVDGHESSRQDWMRIQRKRWWHPYVYTRPRWKTGRRVKQTIE